MSAVTWDMEGDHIRRAWSGNLQIGAVIPVADGEWWFDVTYAVRMRDVAGAAASCGKRSTLDDAKAALETAWATWLQVAGLA